MRFVVEKGSFCCSRVITPDNSQHKKTDKIHAPPIKVNILVESYREFVPENSVLRIFSFRRSRGIVIQTKRNKSTKAAILAGISVASTIAMSTGWTYVVTRNYRVRTSSS